MKIRYIALFLALVSSWLVKAQPQLNDRKSCDRVIADMEKRLNAPFSSTQQEDSCLYILNQLMSSNLLSKIDKLLPEYMIETLNKNRIESTAEDIEFVTTDGLSHRLSEYKTPLKLLYFNDPDCDACALVKARLDTTSLLKQMVEQQLLTVIAVYTLDNENAWRKTPMPAYIVNGWDQAQRIENEETFLLPTMPVFYILDSSNIVKVKNEPSLNNIASYLKELSSHKAGQPQCRDNKK